MSSPDDRGYCPFCHHDAEDAARVMNDEEAEEFRCVNCGDLFDEPIGYEQMQRECREEAASARADLRRDEA